MNINLCEILKGHEGETIYSVVQGYTKIIEVTNIMIKCKIDHLNDDTFNYNCLGQLKRDGECLIFPSKDQRDWNKWDKENRFKIPKTWSDIIVNKNSPDLSICLRPEHNGLHQDYYYEEDYYETPIIKSAVALLKICQLIEVGYGGKVNFEEFDKSYSSVSIIFPRTSDYGNEIEFIEYPADCTNFSPIMFHNQGQAEEFLSYPENVQLLKDYFMIN